MGLQDDWSRLALWHTSTPQYFQILPSPPGTKTSALRCCWSIPRCFWKHLQRWRCIQDTMVSDLQESHGLENVRDLNRSAGLYKRSWDLWTVGWETSLLVSYSHHSGSWGPMGISHFFNHSHLCYNPMNILLHSNMKCIIDLMLCIHTYDQFGRWWYSSRVGGASSDGNWVNFAMNLEAVIMLEGRCTWWEAMIK